MCGIYGWLSLTPDPTVPGHVDSALDRLVHRGPDDRGTYVGEGIFLGARRLSIIDLPGGHQPIWNEDCSMGIVYNGELYNFRELRADLEAKGHVFRTRTDTEVVLHAYEQWGADALRRFNGMFAFAIWDDKQRELFLARDRIGEKPLYYYQDRKSFSFASEIKAIVADPLMERRVDPTGLTNYLALGHAMAPSTMFAGVSKLLPGHHLTIREGESRVSTYWDVRQEVPPGSDMGNVREELLGLLGDSVRLRLMADVPVGLFLSGGVDSTVVLSLMRRHFDGPVKTFSLGFTVGGAYDESADARRIASHFGSEHHELRVDEANLVETLRTLVYHYDEPFGDNASFPLYLLSCFATEHVKVVLTGDGGDELFGGYRRYAVDQLGPAYARLPQVLTEKLVPATIDVLPRFRRLKRTVSALPDPDPVRRYLRWLVVFTPEMRAELLRKETQANAALVDAYRRHYVHLDDADHLNRLMYVDLKTLLADAYMEKTDKATMACSLEGRLPLLDHRFVEAAFRVPAHEKIRGWSTKKLFKETVAELVPEWVLKKPKHGFNVPTDPWFRGELRDFAFEILLDDRAKDRDYFDHRVVERLWKEHIAGRHVWDEQLWLLLNFEMWHRIYLDRTAI